MLQRRLADSAEAAALKGTVLIAAEGINFTLSGAPAALEGWLDALRADERFAPIEIKRQHAAATPFRRLRVKIKPEIIRMDRPAIRPSAQRAPAVDAATLRRWLDAGRCDAGRPVLLLDTRNDFEVDAGAFEGAIDWRLQRFSEFPAALETHREQLAGKTVVSYCTGGIRCEKAALWMAQAGVEHVLQLDGGILRYFEHLAHIEHRPGDVGDVGGAAPHWRGHCFIFDERIALDAALSPAPAPAAP